MVAALTDHKGHRFLLEGWPEVVRERPDARLLLAGSGELEEDLRELADRLEVADTVRFLGFHRDVPGLLAALDLFVMSSHLEGLCTSLMDAMAAGVPVVATTAGGIPELVEDGRTGRLVPPRSPAALSAAVLEVLGDHDLRAHLSRAGRETARERFGIDSMVEGTLEIYHQVLEKKGAS